MNILPIKPNIKITIFGEDHDPSKEFELNATDKNLQCPERSFSKEIDAPYGLSAIVILKEKIYKHPDDQKFNRKENSYEVMHNIQEIHYMHCLFPSQIQKAKKTKTCQIDCAFESWNTGRNMFYFGEEAKEMHIIKSPKWFSDKYEYTEYAYFNHPPITEFVHPSWTGYLPPYAAQPINA